MPELNTKALEDAVAKFSTVEEKLASLDDGNAKTVEQLDELKNELANLTAKPIFNEEVKTHSQIIEEADFGEIFQKFCNSSKAIRAEGFEEFAAKTLNLTNPAEGANAIAEYLDRSILKRATEISPLLGLLGSRPLTRDMRRLVTTTFPDVSEGFENVAGTRKWDENATPKTGEIRSHVFKRQGRYRLTDEAYYGADINLYNDMMMEIARAEAQWLTLMMLKGNGADSVDTKAARGILSKRIDPFVNGESYKPTFAPDPKDARSLDVFPCLLSKKKGNFGTDKETIDFLIDLMHFLPTQYRSSAYFIMSDLTLARLKKVRDANELPIFADYQDGSIRIFGKRVFIEPEWPEMVDGAPCIAYGNLSLGVFLSRGDFTKTVIDEVTTPGQIIINRSEEYFEMGGANDCIVFGVAAEAPKPRP